MRAFFLFALLPSLALGQSGSVSGHVYLADSQQPARYARVSLVPLPLAATSAASGRSPQQYPAETRSDGSFFAAKLPVGDYYVSVTYEGYLSPEYLFSADELLRPTAEIRQHILDLVPTVNVAANKGSTVSVTIRRGAAISGTLRYEDGSPVPDVEVTALRRSASGAWTDVAKAASNNTLFENGGTDDLGRFRIRGLAPGEYSLKLVLRGLLQSGLAVYYGDGFFAKDAKVIALDDGQETAGADIAIRLSTLHSVAGSLVNSSGQPLNFGTIELSAEPDGIKISGGFVDEETATFHIDLVPEGNYRLRVKDAGEIDRHFKDSNQTRDSKGTVYKTYGSYEAPLSVSSDIANLTITIPSLAK